MAGDSHTVALSRIDEDRFGIRIARAPLVTAASLPEILAFCRENDVRMLIARCDTADLGAAQSIERAGGLLMDTLVYYARSLTKSAIPDDTGTATIRPIAEGEDEAVRALASDTFKGYTGHYHADDRLDRDACNAAYESWAHRSCTSREVADEVLVADVDGEVAGFATLRLNSPEEGEGVLFGVGPKAQGRGIYRSFMVQAMEWCKAKGTAKMVVSTQVTNIAVQKVWVRVGFEPSHSYYTFHVWFDENE